MEKMLQIDGLKYISTPRTQKRGGGAAIIVNTRNISLEKIQVINPDKLEVVWGLLRPNKSTNQIREIIACAFYAPPKSKKNVKLLDHLVATSHHLLSKYPSAGLVLGGDKNDLKIAPLLAGIPRLRQIVTKPTYKLKTLDVIMTNLHSLYDVPIITPPVQPDNPQYGAPSDHSSVVAVPLSRDTVSRSRDYETRVYRPLPQSGVVEFGEWICNEKWESIVNSCNPTEQVLVFEKLLQEKLDNIFPQKTLKINPNMDLPYFTCELKELDRQVKREYRKKGKSDKYLMLKNRYDEKLLIASQKYLDKNVRSLMEDDPGKAYRTLKKLAARPGDCTDEGSFTLSSHVEDNLTNEQSTEKIAQYFAQISQEYPPLNPDG